MHRGFGNVVAGVWVVVVAVDAFNENGLSVDEKLAVFDFGGFESELEGVSGDRGVVSFFKADSEGIELGIFRSPGGDIFDIGKLEYFGW